MKVQPAQSIHRPSVDPVIIEELKAAMPIDSFFRLHSPNHPAYENSLLQVVRYLEVGIVAEEDGEIVSNSMATKTVHCFPWEGLIMFRDKGQLQPSEDLGSRE